MTFPPGNLWDYSGSLDILGYVEIENGDGLSREGTVHQFVVPELALLVSRQNIRKNIKRWMDRQHMVMCLGLTSTQKQAQKLIPGPSATAKVRLLSFNP